MPQPYNLQESVSFWLRDNAQHHGSRLVLTALVFPHVRAVLSIPGVGDLELKLPATPGAYKDWGRLFTLWLEDEVRKLAEDFDFIPYRALPRNRIRPIVKEGYTD
jgi:hypothetical protein